jgi:NhaP-type Na+/H+ or K+/H+ antiporter
MGMRGVVTLAAAAGVPASVPGRETIQALAFVVAVGTLLIQGPTLPWLIRKLDISAPHEQEQEAEATRQARELSVQAARESMVAFYKKPPEGVDPAALERMKEHYLAAVEARRNADNDLDTMRGTTKAMRQAILAAQRQALAQARDEGRLDDEIVRRELERLDYEEAAASS